MKNDRLRWSFFKWRVDAENDVTSFWKTNSSNFSSRIDFVNCLFSLIQKRSARRVCVRMLMFVCLRRKDANEKCRFRKSLSFVEFRDFCLLKSIFELITRSLVNIKKKKKKSTLLTKFKKSSLHLRFVTSYKKFTLLAAILVQISDYSILF